MKTSEKIIKRLYDMGVINTLKPIIHSYHGSRNGSFSWVVSSGSNDIGSTESMKECLSWKRWIYSTNLHEIIVNSINVGLIGKDSFEVVFPELKESEGERIRKDIVEAVELHKDFTQERKEHIYAWLEKQGEQKPVWSEEDEDIITKILCICNDFKNSFEISPASTRVIKKDIDKIDSWLKSLKDRVQPQSQWKPSEGHIKALEDAIEFLGCTKKVREDLKLLYEQLKKLREE